MLIPLILATVLGQAAADAPPPPPAPQAPVEVAEGVHFIRAAQVPERGPDGNTIIFEGRSGLIVVDTGRHTYHSDAILNFAREHNRPIAAIVNTHWHLDHSSGNGRLKAVYPRARVYTTRAIERMLAPGGFLTRNEQYRAMLDDPSVSDTIKEEIRIGFDTLAQPDILRPDVAIERSRRMRLGGRQFDVRVTDGAVTDADVWLYDRRTRVLVAGDLVVMPVPYFETACPQAWSAALDEIWATPFETLLPGHGRPMNREQFNAYRTSFAAFVDCVRSDADRAQCGTAWAEGIRPAITEPTPARLQAIGEGMHYYVDYLRNNGGKAPDCLRS